MPQARSQATAAQTDVSLVAAPGAGKQIVVTHVLVSAAAAGTFTLESGTTNRVWEAYLPANDTVVDDGAGQVLFRCADNAALTVTTSAAASGRFTQVTYDVRRTTGNI